MTRQNISPGVWLDNVLVEQMADELRTRGTDVTNPSSVIAALRAADFGQRAVTRLASEAASKV